MNQTFENSSYKGVVCLFCGNSTSLSAQAEQRHLAKHCELRAVIIRCQRCNKEAMYLPEEIINFRQPDSLPFG